MLRIDNLHYSIQGRPLLAGAQATIPGGQRVGLVGPNGCGKTTLLRLIAGELEADSGVIAVQRRCRVGVMAQELADTDRTPISHVLGADTERAALLARAEEEIDPDEVARLHERLADIDAHSAPSRAAAILAGLGFSEADQHRPLAVFSGGWRVRVALAALLFSHPDLLLLDEPTNHLDLEATLWLEGFLRAYPHTVLLVSHDRELLNTVAGRILHLERGRLSLYTGGYDQFERQRRERQAQALQLAERQEQERKRLLSFVERFRAKATKASQAQSRLKRLERMEPVAAVIEERAVAFAFPEPEGIAPPLIRLVDAAVGYEAERPVLAGLHLTIEPDDRIALLGANGNGKTTLARLVSGRLRPMGGEIHRSLKLRVGYFAQHQLDELDPALSAMEQLARAMPEALPQAVRNRLAAFGLEGDKAFVATHSLSGGEKTRLVLAMITRGAPHLLVLDEPTNHLDVDARQALVQALNEFSGAVVLVSHDRHLIESTTDRLWLVEGGAVAPWEGDLDDYRRHLLTRRGAATGDLDEGAGESARRLDRKKDQRREKAKERERLGPLRREVEAAEAEIERLGAEQAQVGAALADPATYAGPGEQVAALGRRQKQLAVELARAEEVWLAAQEALDRAQDQD